MFAIMNANWHSFGRKSKQVGRALLGEDRPFI